MGQTRERKGPAGHRFLVLMLNILLAILIYWLLGFILDDIGNQTGPSLTKIQEQFQDKNLIKQNEALKNQASKLSQIISAQTQQQTLLKTSIDGYRDTMNQLLDLQKASMQKGLEFSAAAQQNLANVTKLYLDNQQKFQNLNHSIADGNTQAQQLQTQIDAIETQLNKQADKASEVYSKQLTWHNYKIAAIQLLVLLPLLIITAYYFKKYRQSIYRPMVIAVGIAIILKIVLVMHEHFPSAAFKYIFILALIYFVVRALIAMLRMVIAPKTSWLIKQYREAYQKMQCAMCQYPIQPGVFKFFIPQTKNQDIKQANMNYLEQVDDYICPSCGEHLFEKCNVCNHMRHTLLIYCDHCGAEKNSSAS
ncbi:MAG: hypothetical protein ACYCQI_02500 [Gammaproteobacteria bacterium]